jgi:hypothetical protein
VITLLLDIGQRIAAVIGELRSLEFLMQRRSVSVQRGEAACVLGTVASNLGLADSFLFIAVSLNKHI